MEVVICAWAEVDAWMEQCDFTHVISIGGASSSPPPSLEACAARLCRLEFFDTVDGGESGPQEHHMLALLDFCEEIQEAGGDVLIHCEMGVSRSSAAALALLARVAGPDGARWAVERLDQLEGSHRAQPNARMVALVDEILGFDGALMTATRRAYGI